MKHEVFTKNAPAVIGPYSQALLMKEFVFCSGQIGINPKTGNFPLEDLKAQTIQVLKNLEAVLKEAGASLDTVIKTTVFLSDMNDYKVMNEEYGKVFKKPYPARATIQVARLPRDAKVEIECIAFINDCPPSHEASAGERGCGCSDCQCR